MTALRWQFAVVTACAVALTSCTSGSKDPEVQAWEQQARNVTIIRDDWGIAHVYGKTDADAVFGAIYAQAEDDFNRVETNFINSQGRLAEAEGESAIWRDLRMKLFINPDSMRSLYTTSPEWLKLLMNAWADGLNLYLHKHPEVKPRVITRFEPWMALTFSEGSIGGDIERINLGQLEAFYGGDSTSAPAAPRGDGEQNAYSEPSGSNGIAIAPANTVDKKALLLINPHTSFSFRSELQMVSEEGLNAYGASTWGQFFIYQGFNERAGWMHTSSGVDNIDEFLETIVRRGDTLRYRYGSDERPVMSSVITVPYKTESGMAERRFTVYRTHRGPIVRAVGGKWVSVSLMHDPVNALTQSYKRTKAKNLKEFLETMELHTNSSNNTLFADAEGNIAYLHANFIPKRDARFDWMRPVDGSNPATEWGKVHAVDEAPNVINPPNGWVYNTNNSPWSAAGEGNSPRMENYPRYVESGTENARGIHAIMVLKDRKDFTLDGLVSAAYDSYLTWFTDKIPALVRAYDRTPASSPLRTSVAEQVEQLRGWDMRWSVTSVPTSLAVFWGDGVSRAVGADARRANMTADQYIATRATPQQLLQALAAASEKLTADFGKWQTPWGEINRFQRITAEIAPAFSDTAPSIPVGFTSARWGSLASYGARAYSNTKKWYGTSGNSFVAVVEFGDSVRARAVTAGGESGDMKSPHFNDQAERYSKGDLRPVYFYRSQLRGHTERTYRPGG
jgi:acyl-homoserine lactone acylase PvdQ